MTRLHFASICAAALIACGSSEPAPTKPKVQVVSGHAAPKPGDFGSRAFQCCDTPAATAVITDFVALSTALSSDDLPASTAAVTKLSTTLAQHGDSLPESAQVARIRPLVERMTAHTDLGAIREEFLDASMDFIAIAQAHQGGSQPLSVAYCPMKPGRWLQTKEPLVNPYYGAEMLHCGTFERLDELPAATP